LVNIFILDFRFRGNDGDRGFHLDTSILQYVNTVLSGMTEFEVFKWTLRYLDA
jgi:hypothetical protein